jgi:hypothetical protein
VVRVRWLSSSPNAGSSPPPEDRDAQNLKALGPPFTARTRTLNYSLDAVFGSVR